MKAFKLILAAAFLATSFSVHADATNATVQVYTKNQGNGKWTAISNINKPKPSSSRTLKPVK